MLIKPTANALYIAWLGVENLPYIYIAVAVVAFLVSSLYSRFSGIMSAKNLFIWSSYISIILLVLIGLMMRFQIQLQFSIIVLYLFMSIFGILSVSQFWIIANQIFNAREARRYYGIIGLGAISGGIMGGYLASAISTIFRSEVLLYTAAFMVFLAVLLLHKIKVDSQNKPESGPRKFSIAEPFKLVIQSRHLKYLAIVLALSVFVAKTIDYQFGYFASRNFSDSDKLTAFYGFWYSNFNLVSLLIQLFLTTRIVGKFGVGYSLLILPLLLLINVGLLILIPSLIFALTGKMTEASVKQSINKASMELIMLPIPEDLKLKTKTFIDVFIDSLATGISGIVLIIYVKGLEVSNVYISIIILIVILLWLYFANKMRFEYKSVFRQSLHLRSAKFDIDNQNIMEDYIQVFERGDIRQITKALKFLESRSIDGMESHMIKLLQHENKEVVIETLEMLMYKGSDYSDHVKPLLNHESANVNILAFEYLINHQRNLSPDFLTQILHTGSKRQQLTAIAAFAKEFQNDPRTLDLLRIRDRIRSHIEGLDEKDIHYKNISIALLKSIGYGRLQEFSDFILKQLNSDIPELRHHALLAAGQTQSKKFLDLLIHKLDNEPNPVLYKALGKYHHSILKSLYQKWKRKNKIERLKHLPFILQHIPQQQSISIMQELLEHENLEVRDNCIHALCFLRDRYPLLIIDEKLINRLLLEEARYNNKLLQFLTLKQEEKPEKSNASLIPILKEKIDANLSIIFSLLHIKYPPEEYLDLYGYVNSSDQILRNNAIEYLENSLGNDLKKIIIPMLDMNNIDFGQTKESEEFDEIKIKTFLLENRDQDIRSAALLYFS